MIKLKDITPFPCRVRVTVKDSSDHSIIGLRYEFLESSTADFHIRHSECESIRCLDYRHIVLAACDRGLGTSTYLLRGDGYYMELTVSVF